jgi:hypothetical protein
VQPSKNLLNSFLRLLILVCCSATLGATNPSPSQAAASETRDGQHDFDFEIGTWKTHLRRLLHPLTGSNRWVECDGTTAVHKVWNGRANLVELEANCPGGHLEALSLRLYNPESHQWSLNFANSKSPTLSPPTIGKFRNGQGEFFDQETFNGQAVFVRFVISDITRESCRFEQSFSSDGGKTWEPNWIAVDSRVPERELAKSAAEENSEQEQPHDFEFELGSWNIHLRRLLHPLSGSKDWVEFDGTTVTRKVWGGRSQIEEFEVNNPSAHIEGLTLRLYDPQSRQWYLYWANSKNGILAQPTIGEFKNGRGEFLDQEPFNGRAILVRYVWSGITPSTAHFEQSFSDDGGETWEVNWITDQRRVKKP